MVDYFFKGFIKGIQVAVCAAQVQFQPLPLQWLQYVCMYIVQPMIKEPRMLKRRK